MALAMGQHVSAPVAGSSDQKPKLLLMAFMLHGASSSRDPQCAATSDFRSKYAGMMNARSNAGN
jgi:hypothetical protein